MASVLPKPWYFKLGKIQTILKWPDASYFDEQVENLSLFKFWIVRDPFFEDLWFIDLVRVEKTLKIKIDCTLKLCKYNYVKNTYYWVLLL